MIYPINRVQDDAAGRVHRGRRGAGDARASAPASTSSTWKGKAASTKGAPPAPRATRWPPSTPPASRSRSGPRSSRSCSEVVVFVKHIRGRIEELRRRSATRCSAYLDQQKKAHPELAELIARDGDAHPGDRRNTSRRAAPASRRPQYVVDLTEEFRSTLLDYEGDDALDKCNAITDAIVDVGGNQDELVGECRMAVKVLRQRAGLAMAARSPRGRDRQGNPPPHASKCSATPPRTKAPRH